jgi:hypothetical protein
MRVDASKRTRRRRDDSSVIHRLLSAAQVCARQRPRARHDGSIVAREADGGISAFPERPASNYVQGAAARRPEAPSNARGTLPA